MVPSSLSDCFAQLSFRMEKRDADRQGDEAAVEYLKERMEAPEALTTAGRNFKSTKA